MILINTEGINSFLKNVAAVAQSAEQVLLVLATFITTGVGGVLVAVSQVKKRIHAAEVDEELATKMLKLNEIEELIKKDQSVLSAQRNLAQPVLIKQTDPNTGKTEQTS